MSSAAKRPASRHPRSWEMNLDVEELVIPDGQADITPPDYPDPPRGRAGELVRALAKVFSDTADAKLNAKGPLGALMQVAFVARTADEITWEEMADLSRRGSEQPYSRLSPGQALVLRKLITADQPKAQVPNPAKPRRP